CAGSGNWYFDVW
nr:immunoglobulin heavy chain junction region [Mus musculus]